MFLFDLLVNFLEWKRTGRLILYRFDISNGVYALAIYKSRLANAEPRISGEETTKTVIERCINDDDVYVFLLITRGKDSTKKTALEHALNTIHKFGKHGQGP